VTEHAARLQLDALAPLGADRAAECLRLSIVNGWAGLFPERFATPAGPEAPAAPSAEPRVKRALDNPMADAPTAPPWRPPIAR
jgi:hypothetical protein